MSFKIQLALVISLLAGAFALAIYSHKPAPIPPPPPPLSATMIMNCGEIEGILIAKSPTNLTLYTSDKTISYTGEPDGKDAEERTGPTPLDVIKALASTARLQITLTVPCPEQTEKFSTKTSL